MLSKNSQLETNVESVEAFLINFIFTDSKKDFVVRRQLILS